MVEAQTKARPLIWNSSRRIDRSMSFCEGFSFSGHSTALMLAGCALALSSDVLSPSCQGQSWEGQQQSLS